MGYGSRAIESLYRYFNGEMVSLVDAADDDDSEASMKDASPDEDSEGEETGESGIHGEKLKPRKELPPLLLPLTEVEAPKLDWVGTSYGLTHSLHKFWSRAGLRLLYLRQTKNELTGEHSAIMLRSLPRRSGVDDAWLPAFMSDTRRRIISLLSGSFRHIDLRLALSMLESFDLDGAKRGEEDTINTGKVGKGKLTADELEVFLSPHDLKRLELYGRNLCDHHLVTDLLPTISQLYFSGRLGHEFSLSSVQAALLCGIGLQHRSVDDLTADLKLPGNQVLAMFNKSIRKISLALNAVVEEKEKQAMLGGKKREAAEAAADRMKDVAEKTLDEDAEDAAKEAMETLNSSNNLPPEIAEDEELMQYAVKGSDAQWSRALENKNVEGGVQTIRIQSFQDKKEDPSSTELEKKRKRDEKPGQNGKKSKGKSSKRKSKK